MPSQDTLERFIARVESNAHVEAIAEFYTEGASMQENHNPPRVGREQLMAHEAAALARASTVQSRCVRPAFVNGDHVVVRWVFDFSYPDGSRRHIEELAWQRWEGERIAQEQFFYDPKQSSPSHRPERTPRSTAMPMIPTHYRLRAVIGGGMAAGVMDICYAIIFWALRASVPPERILQSVASGLLGKAAYSGGWLTALLGLALHFGMTVTMALVFYAAARRVPALVRHPVPAGLAYGLAIYAVMNFVVLPLSAFPNPQTFALWPTVGGVLIHMLGVGVPIALFTQRALRNVAAAAPA